MKILADATINNISSSSSSCEVSISNIQEYSNFSKLPEYLYVIVDYSKEIGTQTNKDVAEAKAHDARDADDLVSDADLDINSIKDKFKRAHDELQELELASKAKTRSSENREALRKAEQKVVDTREEFEIATADANAARDKAKRLRDIAQAAKPDLARKDATDAHAIADALTRDTTMTHILKDYDRNLSFITNSKARKTYALDLDKYIPSDYKNFYGVYKLVANSYYVKVYQEEISDGTPPPQSEDLKLNVLLMYNGSSWVFYILTQKTFKDFVYVKMFLKNDIENYITTDFYYIGQDKNVKNAGSNYKIIFTTQLPEDIIRADLPENSDLVVGDKTIPVEYSEKRLDADTSKLITT